MRVCVCAYREQPVLEHQIVKCEGQNVVCVRIDLEGPDTDEGVVWKQLHLFTGFLGQDVLGRQGMDMEGLGKRLHLLFGRAQHIDPPAGLVECLLEERPAFLAQELLGPEGGETHLLGTVKVVPICLWIEIRILVIKRER